MPQIVYINVSTTATETPDNLQQMGAIVSFGGTSLTTGTYQAITSTADFTAIASSASADVGNAVTDFYKQGSGTVYVLELGSAGTPSTLLDAYISSNPKTFYGFLIPDGVIASDSQFATMVQNYVAQDSMTYFFLNCTQEQAAAFNKAKSVIAHVPSPDATSTELLAAHTFYEVINSNPSASNKLAPFAFRYLYGVTPWADKGNSAVMAEMKAANLNFAGTGAQGGVSKDLLFWGYTLDGKPIFYWYAVDWVQIHLARDLAYEIITGSNSKVNPLIYDQRGITRLQTKATGTLNNGINFGCIVSGASVSAISYGDYITANPGDYATGTYNGLSATITPMRGFEQITFYLSVDLIGSDVTTTTTTGS